MATVRRVYKNINYMSVQSRLITCTSTIAECSWTMLGPSRETSPEEAVICQACPGHVYRDSACEANVMNKHMILHKEIRRCGQVPTKTTQERSRQAL